MSPRKKILFVITKSNWGGAQRYVYDLATHLQEDLFEVAVAFGQSGLLTERLEVAGVRTHLIQSLSRDISIYADIRSFFELLRLFKKERPDIVHLNSSKAGAVGALAARLARVPRIIFTAHGWPFEEKRDIFWRSFVFLASWATALLAHATIVVSEKDLRIGRRMPFCSRKMHLIYNGVAPLALGSGDVIRSAFPPKAHITGTIGELTKNKNQIALIEEARRAPDRFVAIVGEGEDRPMLETKIREYGLTGRVKLFGFLDAKEVLKGFDEFALPSLKEGLPYVLLEAKAAELPIVADRTVGGIADILDAPTMDAFSLETMLRRTREIYRR